LALGLAAAGCGDDGAGDEAATEATDGSGTTAAAGDSSATATTSESPLGGVTTTTTEDHEGFTDLELVAPELLIRAAELGVDGAEDLGYTPPPPPPGCPAELDAGHPADVHVGTTIAAGGITVVEALRVFADAGTASVAYDAWVGAEPSCRLAPPAASGPTDVNDRVGADASMSFASAAGDDVLVLALLGDAVVSVRTSGTATAADGTPLLPPLDVAAYAVGKLLAALET
jgi:hypothetical protein